MLMLLLLHLMHLLLLHPHHMLLLLYHHLLLLVHLLLHMRGYLVHPAVPPVRRRGGGRAPAAAGMLGHRGMSVG
jgi:hypothetical protein